MVAARSPSRLPRLARAVLLLLIVLTHEPRDEAVRHAELRLRDRDACGMVPLIGGEHRSLDVLLVRDGAILAQLECASQVSHAGLYSRVRGPSVSEHRRVRGRTIVSADIARTVCGRSSGRTVGLGARLRRGRRPHGRSDDRARRQGGNAP